MARDAEALLLQLLGMVKQPALSSLPGSVAIVVIKAVGSIAAQRPQYLGRVLPSLLSAASASSGNDTVRLLTYSPSLIEQNINLGAQMRFTGNVAVECYSTEGGLQMQVHTTLRYFCISRRRPILQIVAVPCTHTAVDFQQPSFEWLSVWY